MKASPYSLSIRLISLFLFSFVGFAQTGQYTVQVDSMIAKEAAEAKVQQLKTQGLNAYWLKSNVPGQGVRYRVRLGRFATRSAAQNYGLKMKQQGQTSDFFVALYEGASSSLITEQAVKKTAPPSTVPVLSKPPQTAPQITVTEKNPTPAPAQRQREVKTVQTNSANTKPTVNSPIIDTRAKSNTVTPAPITSPPVNTGTPNNSGPKTTPSNVTPTENKPVKSTPQLPSPLNEIKPPRDKKAENTQPSESKTSESVQDKTASAIPSKPIVTPNPSASSSQSLSNKVAESALAKPAKQTVAAATSAVPLPSANFSKFEDNSFGYSFDRPIYWSGGNLNPQDLQAQRIDSGAVFRSPEDAAFAHAIWNSLKNANSPAYDNNLIVDLVIKSIGNSQGMQGLTESARRMVQEGDQIKTYVDLRTLFRQPRANSPLEFQGKAVIIRANTGILLVVAFYSKESAPTMIPAAEKIINSARVP